MSGSGDGDKDYWFLNYNAHPAKIFLGDTGSLLLGFFLLFSSVSISNKLSLDELDLTFAIIVLGVPIIDTLKVMLTRILKKKNPGKRPTS